METFSVAATHNTPRIYLSPEENIYEITGKSAPEDVRSLYYPVIDWLERFIREVNEKGTYDTEQPLTLLLFLLYFNSSSAKFIFDILKKLKELTDNNIPVVIEWHYEEGDVDLKEAGEDMATLSGLTFRYCVEKGEK